jgi:hypothetical protein
VHREQGDLHPPAIQYSRWTTERKGQGRIWTYWDELCAAYHGVVEADVLFKPREW